MNERVKVGIVLEGGGAKGAYQVGALRAINELKISYDCVFGTSIGSLNAISYILHDYENSFRMWKDSKFFINNNQSVSIEPMIFLDKFKSDIDDFENQYMKYEGIDPEPVIQFLKEAIDEDKIRASNIDLGLTTYCLSDRKPLKLFIKDIPKGLLHEFIFASCYLPVFTPRKINGKYYLDGSFFSRLPIEMAVENKCDVIIAIRLRPDNYDFKKFNNIKIIDIAPDEFLSSTLETSKERILWMINKGYEDAIRILRKK